MLIEVVIDIEQEGLYILKGKYSPQGKKKGMRYSQLSGSGSPLTTHENTYLDKLHIFREVLGST